MKRIFDNFPALTEAQRESFLALEPLYRGWNSRINVVSRRDIDNLPLHHILHSLAIAKAAPFAPGDKVLDLGTGGGFPGIPLAILFPEVNFTLCDSVGKKITVASSVAAELGLKNVECRNARAEELAGGFDHVVSRAVAPLDTLCGWVRGKYSGRLIVLKGGDLDDEILRCSSRYGIPRGRITVVPVKLWFDDPYFEEKHVVII